MSAPRARALACALVLTFAGGVRAQQAPASAGGPTSPDNWWLLDPGADRMNGISGERAFRELLAGLKPKRGVVVAIIDSGIDTAHAELHGSLWLNPKETAAGDGDGDGLVGDVRGWDYIGGPGGKDVDGDTFEMTRQYAALRQRFDVPAPDTTSAQARADYAHYRELRDKVAAKRTEALANQSQVEQIGQAIDRAMVLLRQALGTQPVTVDNVRKLTALRTDLAMARSAFLQLAAAGLSPADIDRARHDARSDLEFHLNPDFDPRPVVGDNYADVNQRAYGNSDVTGPDAMHGTHVAGIVLGVPGNREKLEDGTPAVRIMTIRAVPDGDERDKDIANGIRYAVDHGANIISMSFGKDESPQKSVVDAAARYADAHGVLMVHAAGNDGANLDSATDFPNRYFLDGGQAANWMEVGASSWKGAEVLAADFSNYSKTRVDLFAPGVDILSTLPGDAHGRLSGTSMAAPVVSGVAALLMAYFPQLTATQVRQLLLQSATSFANQLVERPGSGDNAGQVRFGDLSVSGGIVNEYAAVKAAQQVK